MLTTLKGSDLRDEAPRRPAHVPGPLRLARSPHAGGHASSANRSGAEGRARREEQRDRVRVPAARGRVEPAVGAALSPRVLGRPAPAHRPGPGPGARAETGRGGRAGVGARRVHSGPDPQPHEGPAAPARPDLRDDLARPGGRSATWPTPSASCTWASWSSSGPSAEVYDHPAHPYTQGLLDAVPRRQSWPSRAERKLIVRGELPSAVNPPSGCRFRTRCPRAQNLCAEVEPLLVSFGVGPHGGLPLPAADAGRSPSRQSAAAGQRP